MSAFADLAERIERPDGVRRLGQALWMMVGTAVDPASLLWARGLLGWGGDTLLWSALRDEHCLELAADVLEPQRLSAFLCRLWGVPEAETAEARLVWTLPAQLAVDGVERDSYARAAIALVESARRRVTIVSPYLEPRGMGLLQDALLGALRRSVSIVLLTHDVDDISSLASASLESLRRESSRLPGSLTVYTTVAMPEVLLHLKIVSEDGLRAIVGSANVTGKGFGHNLEAGVLLGPTSAVEIEHVVSQVIAAGLVTRVFGEGSSRQQN